MGEQEGGWAEPSGLLANESLIRKNLDSEQWLKAEERTAELIASIQPNQPSEERRNAVANYVHRLITKCFPCRVFTFGSVPLKTYLPDGDIDVTAFSNDENMKDMWANQVRDMLVSEEKDENAEFSVREVQYIQADVKLIKCLVENIVVDISFNQLGGLCTLCFLEEVDSLINQNHLFKRSIILIKAWCYYESRLLGAHHGLISTYALETLVLYIFHLFNSSFAGPLEVLYRFLEFFSKFDWDNFCVSLWGPVPISLLPDVTAEPPRKDNGQLLLSKLFLDACNTVYAVFPGGQDNQGQSFVSKHFNVIDPLRINNNLGRSVSKGNFYRIRGAFAFGAKRLARLLDCSKDELYFEVNHFFKNTWDRHGSQNRPDAPMNTFLQPRLSGNPDHVHKSENLKNISSSKIIKENGYIPSQRLWNYRTDQRDHVDNRQSSYKFDHLGNELQGRFHFARTSSSPELTDTYKDIPSKGKPNRAIESGKVQISAAGLNAIRKNLRPEILASQYTKSLVNDHSSVNQNHDDDTESNNFVVSEEIASDARTLEWLQNEQDSVNMMPSTVPGLRGQVHMPMNLSLPHLPNPFSPQRNFAGVLPPNFPLMDSWGSNMQFPPAMVPSRMTHYFPGIGLTTKHEDSIGTGIGKYGSVKLGSEDFENNFGLESENLEMILSNDQHPSTSSWTGLSGTKDQIKTTKEIPTVRPRSSMSKTSSENSWEGSSTNNELSERSRHPLAVTLSNIAKHPSLELAQTGVTDLSIPISPLGQSEMENSGDVPLRFYTTGPPVPFLTMLPVYNYPTENGNSESSCNFGEDEVLDNNHFYQNFISSDRPDHLQLLNIFNSMRRAANGEESEECKSDILNSDIVSHWENLLYGRFCQNPQNHGPLFHHLPASVPAMYLQGRFPWDGPGRPLSTNMNLFTQIMSHEGPRLVPVAPLQSVSHRPSGVYQCYMDEMPRHRTGTGTYLPNPKVIRDRQQPGTRRGNYSYDRSGQHCDRSDRESNWNSNSKTRGALRNHNRSQTDRSNPRMNKLAANESRAERTYRPDSFHSYDSQNGTFRSNSTQCRSANMTYGVNPNGVFPFDRSTFPTEKLECGSLGPVGFSGKNEMSRLSEGSRPVGSYEEHRLHNSSD